MATTVMTASPKCFYFLRHSLTETNEYLRRVPWGSDKFRDPGLWDTRLSPQGILLCQILKQELQSQRDPSIDGISLSKIDLLVTSPLTRTLQTSSILFPSGHPLLSAVPKIVQPLLTERVYMASDVGRHKSLLLEEFPDYDFSQVPEDRWWYEHCDQTHKPYQEWRPPGQYDVLGEPEYLFRERILRAKSWLLSLPQNNVLVVCHWAVLRGLTGMEFKNLEMRKVCGSELLSEPHIDG